MLHYVPGVCDVVERTDQANRMSERYYRWVSESRSAAEGTCAPVGGLAASILFRFGLVLDSLDQDLDLLNEHRQIESSKTHLRRRNAIVLDVGRNVLVMKVCTFQGQLVWMWLRIVPVQFLFACQTS